MTSDMWDGPSVPADMEHSLWLNGMVCDGRLWHAWLHIFIAGIFVSVPAPSAVKVAVVVHRPDDSVSDVS